MKKLMLAIIAVLAITMQSHASIEYDSFTPLMRAIATKEPASEVRRLIDAGEDVSAVDTEMIRWINPVLRYALDRGTDAESVEIIRMLIQAGADVNAITYNRIQDKQLYGMMPLLTYAAIYSTAEVVQMFVAAGARDTILGKDGICFTKTALEIAQELGKTDVVKLLEKRSKPSYFTSMINILLNAN